METKVEVLEGNKVAIEVTIPAAEVKTRIANQYKAYARQYNFPGFRKGKAPRRIIDNALGEDAVRAAVTDDLMEDTIAIAIDGAGVMPVGQADVKTQEMVVEGEDYVYCFELNVKPTFELSSYDAVEIEMPADGASDEEIDEQIDALTKYYVEYKDAPANTKVKKENYVKLAIAATDDAGEDIAAISAEERLYGMGTNLLPQSFEDEIMGMKKGEEKEFSIDLAEDETAVLAAGVVGKTQKINFKVTCVAVQKEVKPELTDEWVAANMGFATEAELRERIAEQIKAQKEEIFPQLKEQRCLAVLGERLQGEPSADYVEQEEANLLQEFFQQLQRAGMTFDGYLQQQGIDSEQFKNDVKAQAKDVATQDLALDAWAKHFELEATEEELLGEFVRAGVDNPKKAVEEWRRAGRLPMVREGVARTKAVMQITEQAIVTIAE